MKFYTISFAPNLCYFLLPACSARCPWLCCGRPLGTWDHPTAQDTSVNTSPRRQEHNRPVSYSRLPLITMTIDSFYSMSLDLMLNIHKFLSGYELFTTLCIVGDSDIAGIYEYLTSSRGSYCKNESIVIVISGNWE